VHAVLEDCAMIAGWMPYRKAQMRYVRDSQSRSIVSTRVVSQEGIQLFIYLLKIFTFNIDDSQGLVEKELCCPLRYHNLTELNNLWNNRSNIVAIRDEFCLR
jgi:hypothetical protein